MDEKQIEIGKFCKHVREKRGLTITEASDHTGVSRGMIYKIENGKTDPKHSSLDKLRELYRVSKANFFNFNIDLFESEDQGK